MPVLIGANENRIPISIVNNTYVYEEKRILDMKAIESERLFLRPLTLEDDEFILQLLNTDGFIKYIGDRNVKTIEQAKNYLMNGPLKSYETNGFGLSLVELKTDSERLSVCVAFLKEITWIIRI